MAIAHLPRISRLPIESRNDVAGVEGLISAVAGVIAATGGQAALGGDAIFSMSVEERAAVLNAMYGEGEVVFGWRHREGAVVNIALDKVSVEAGPRRRDGWRALVYVEEEDGHALCGAMLAPAITALSQRTIALANQDRPGAMQGEAAAALDFLDDSA
jgi:hypothetical protein